MTENLPLALFVASVTNSGMTPKGRPRERRGPRGEFAEKLRATRASRGVTQEQAAAAIGCDRVTLARWESGTHEPVGIIRAAVEKWIARKTKGGQRGD